MVCNGQVEDQTYFPTFNSVALVDRQNFLLTSLHRGRSAWAPAKSNSQGSSNSNARRRCVGPRSIVSARQDSSDAGWGEVEAQVEEQRCGGGAASIQLRLVDLVVSGSSGRGQSHAFFCWWVTCCRAEGWRVSQQPADWVIVCVGKLNRWLKITFKKRKSAVWTVKLKCAKLRLTSVGSAEHLF